LCAWEPDLLCCEHVCGAGFQTHWEGIFQWALRGPDLLCCEHVRRSDRLSASPRRVYGEGRQHHWIIQWASGEPLLYGAGCQTHWEGIFQWAPRGPDFLCCEHSRCSDRLSASPRRVYGEGRQHHWIIQWASGEPLSYGAGCQTHWIIQWAPRGPDLFFVYVSRPGRLCREHVAWGLGARRGSSRP